MEGTATFPENGLADCAVSWNVRVKYAEGVTMVDICTRLKRKIRWDPKREVIVGDSQGTSVPNFDPHHDSINPRARREGCTVP